MLKSDMGGADERPSEVQTAADQSDIASIGLPLIPIEAVAGFPVLDVHGVRLTDCEYYSVPAFEERGAQYLIRVSGQSMDPTFQNGDLLGCRKVTEVTFLQWGEVYVLDTAQGALVKRVFPSDEDGAIKCVSDNTSYPPFTIQFADVRSLSSIVGLIRMS